MYGYHNPRWILPKHEPEEVVRARREKAAAKKGMSLAEYEVWQAEEAAEHLRAEYDAIDESYL